MDGHASYSEVLSFMDGRADLTMESEVFRLVAGSVFGLDDEQFQVFLFVCLFVFFTVSAMHCASTSQGDMLLAACIILQFTRSQGAAGCSE